MSKGFAFKLRSGPVIDVPARLLQTYKECFFDETYFRGFPKDRALPAAPVVLDVGANVGYFSLSVFAKRPKAKVVAYEPMPTNFALLSRYAKENPAFDWTPVQEALSSAEGTLVLHYDASDAFKTSASVEASAKEPDRATVRATTLRAAFAAHGLERLDLLKLDCEGSEYDVLYEAPPEILAKVDALAIETHRSEGPRRNKAALVAFLRERGFATTDDRDIVWARRA
jgi:FkbM family methyltransferase